MPLRFILRSNILYMKRSRPKLSIAVYRMPKFLLVPELWTCDFRPFGPKIFPSPSPPSNASVGRDFD